MRKSKRRMYKKGSGFRISKKQQQRPQKTNDYNITNFESNELNSRDSVKPGDLDDFNRLMRNEREKANDELSKKQEKNFYGPGEPFDSSDLQAKMNANMNKVMYKSYDDISRPKNKTKKVNFSSTLEKPVEFGDTRNVKDIYGSVYGGKTRKHKRKRRHRNKRK